MDPASTGLHVDCCGSDCKYPEGQSMHWTLPFRLENLPGEQGTQETEPVLLVYVPIGHGVLRNAAPAHVYPRSQTFSMPFNVYDPGGMALHLTEPLPDVNPCGQKRHLLASVAVPLLYLLGRYCPFKHKSHVPLMPIPASPASHLVQVTLPASALPPSPQESHLVTRAMTLDAVLVAHGLQDVVATSF